MKIRKISIVLLLLLLNAIIFLASCSGNTVSKKAESFTFVQICDPQLGFSDYEKDKESFRQTVRRVNELNSDFVVICGDLVSSVNEKSYSDFKKIQSGFQVPCYCVPGNHDVCKEPNSLQYYRKMIGEDYFIIDHKGSAFIFVNTQLWKEQVQGESEKQDTWLKKELKVAFEKEQEIFIIGHYPLFCKERYEPDQYMNLPKEKRNELLELFDQYEVAAVLGGHTHQLTLNNYKDIQLVNGETISKNFDNRPLGFRVWHVEKGLSPKHEFVPLYVAKPLK